jgi:chromosome segregation and condensation protein ScpB
MRRRLSQAAGNSACRKVSSALSGPPVGDGLGTGVKRLTNRDPLTLVSIAYIQPITRAELNQFCGNEVGWDTIDHLQDLKFIGCSPPYELRSNDAMLSFWIICD